MKRNITICDLPGGIGSMFFLDELNQVVGIEGVCHGAFEVEIDGDFVSINGHDANAAPHPLGRESPYLDLRYLD